MCKHGTCALCMCMQQHVLRTLWICVFVFGGAHHLIIAFLWSFAIELFYSCSFGLVHCQLFIWFDWAYFNFNFNRNTQYFTIEAPILQFSENQLPVEIEMCILCTLCIATATFEWMLAAYGVLESIAFDLLRFDIHACGMTNCCEGNKLVSSHFDAIKCMTDCICLKMYTKWISLLVSFSPPSPRNSRALALRLTATKSPFTNAIFCTMFNLVDYRNHGIVATKQTMSPHLSISLHMVLYERACESNSKQ